MVHPCERSTGAGGPTMSSYWAHGPPSVSVDSAEGRDALPCTGQIGINMRGWASSAQRVMGRAWWFQNLKEDEGTREGAQVDLAPVVEARLQALTQDWDSVAFSGGPLLG